MTSQKDQVQALIAEIDGVLQKASPRLPWVMSGEATQQRRVLERVRNYLVSLQKRIEADSSRGNPAGRSDLLAYDVQYPAAPAPSQGYPTGQGYQNYGASGMTAQQMLQAVVQEMGYLRSSVMQPLLAELESLRQQREGILQEIRQLEGQRQGYPSNQPPLNQQQVIAEFLQVLMVRLQDSLSQQVMQTLQRMASQPLPYSNDPMLPSSYGGAMTPDAYPSLESLQALQAHQALQSQSDQLLVNLDSTLRVVFEALQRDITAYQESLSQGLDRMHTLGHQGEMMFTALVNHLAQQLGREASSFLQSSGQLPELTATTPANSTPPPPPVAPTTPVETNLSPASAVSPSVTSNLLPYPGSELVASLDAASTIESVPSMATESGVDAAIDSWLQSISTPTAPSTPATNPNSSDLSLDLDELDLAAIEVPDLEISGLEETPDRTPATSPSLPTEAGSPASTFSTAIEAGSPPTDTQPPIDAQQQIDRILRGEAIDPEPPPPIAPVHEELDEFYASLFGTEGATQTEPGNSATAASPTASAPVDPTLGWDLAPLPAPSRSGSPSSHQSDSVLQPDPGAVSDLSVPSVPPEGSAVAPLEEPLDAEPDEISTLTDLFANSSFDSIAQAAPGSLLDLSDELMENTIENESRGAMNVEVGAGAEIPDGALGSSLPPAIDLPTQNLFNQVLEEPQAPARSSSSLGQTSEDDYIPASPDESLLPPETDTANPSPQFWLDDTTFSSLSEDLSSLEGVSERSPIEAFQDPIEQSDLNLDNFMIDPDAMLGAAALDDATSDDLDWSSLSLSELTSDLTTLPVAPENLEQSVEPSSIVEASLETTAAPRDPLSAIDSAFTTDSAFTLEGMEDLFADQPSTSPNSSPVPPRSLETQALTLEGMDDLFNDVPSVSATPVPPPLSPASEEEAFTLEGMEDLFADVPPTAGSPPDSSLEGIEDLFADTSVTTSNFAIGLDSAPSATTAIETDEDDSTLNLADLFADSAIADSPTSNSPIINSPTATSPAVTAPISNSSIANSPIAPPTTPSSSASDPATFTLEQVGDLFIEVPEIAPSPATVRLEPPAGLEPPLPTGQPATEQPAAFQLQQQNGVFIEVPIPPLPSPGTSSSNP